MKQSTKWMVALIFRQAKGSLLLYVLCSSQKGVVFFIDPHTVAVTSSSWIPADSPANKAKLGLVLAARKTHLVLLGALVGGVDAGAQVRAWDLHTRRRLAWSRWAQRARAWTWGRQARTQWAQR